MKKLLPPTLNRWFCYALVLLCSAMYAQPCTFNDVIERTIYSSYKKYNADLDMLAVLNYKKTDFYGFIGVNRKRLRITFTSMRKSKENKDIYEVEGFITVLNPSTSYTSLFSSLFFMEVKVMRKRLRFTPINP